MVLKLNLCASAVLLVLGLLSMPIAANESGCVSYYDSAKDYFPDKVESKYASGFSIAYTNNAKYIRNSISGETYVLYQCGTPAPADANPTPASSLQVGNWTKLVAVPGTKIALDSAPASAAIELLGAQDSVAAAYKYFEVTSPCMQQRLDALPRIQQNFGTPSARRRRSSGSSSHLVRRVSYDLSSLGLQWTFTTYGMSDPSSIAVNPENAADMLGKAEWIKFVAAFFNKEAEANQIFAGIESRYNALKTSAASTAAKKTIGLARYNKVANGTVLGWAIDQVQPWLARGLADAGLKAYSGDSVSFHSASDFYKAISGWDIMIDVSGEPLPHGGSTIPEWTNISSGYGFSNGAGRDFAKSLPAVAHNSIYRSDLISSYQNATDYNEHLQIQADALLGDYIEIASAASGTTSAKWYRNMPLQMPVEWMSSAGCH
ncbi:hypothetical protein GGI04_001501 [Coemansia thaxteri]|uniref:Uncharacterized protein n=1 Tax=Coemansia thaxteri TaxID=2663907 RepID=A0A9W8BE39_9FUNG|nr:hypothetical protein H4R26_002591 [Coemansia thaxteri]KAJ2007462.1 hypothetical protein GGI04_001501 [Coemansia thaxteri]KAJ2474147.1 hypothetical protein GGI02_000274 [Coemansia sp. RSA 2322]KAJ2484840.1 hypothetical protein EV174_002141 [Coemansia sp. RSA 2320]